MTRENIKAAAYMDEMPEQPMTCAERCLFYALRETYRQYRNGTITKETGEKQMHSAYGQFARDVEEADAARKILYHNADMWMSIEQAANRYAQNRTLENADAFIEAVYGCKMKQNGGDKNEQNRL